MRLLPDSLHSWPGLALRAWLIAALALLTGCLFEGDDTPSARPATFTNLGFLPGHAMSRASAVSADGSVVVGTATTAGGGSQAFRWTATTGMAGLGFLPGGTRSAATGVSADGSVVVGTGDTSGTPPTPSSAWRWSVATGTVRVQPVSGSYLCAASGVSGDGATVAGTCLTVNDEAFRWTESSGPTGLGRFGGGSNQTSSAAAISSNGALIVGAGHPVLTGAVSWPTGASATLLGKLPGDASARATAVSRDGTVIVGASTDGAQVSRAFVWTQSTGMVALDGAAAGLRQHVAAGVSGDGTIVVGWATLDNADIAIVWDAKQGLRRLDVALATEHGTDIGGWKLERATAISDDGRTIAGFGTDPLGQTEGWIVRLPD